MSPKGAPGEIPSIACIRCRHRKKKCDHALPTCGQCKRANSECVRFQERKPRDTASVPWEYVKGLELHLAEVEKNLAHCQALLRKQGSTSVRLAQRASSFDSSTLGCWPGASASNSDGASPSPFGPMLITNLHEPPGEQIFVANSPASATSRDGSNSMLHTPIHSYDAPFLPINPSDDDIGLLRKADFACYFQFVHPDWPFLEQNVIARWFHGCVEQRALTRNYQSYFVQMVCAIGAFYSSRSDRGCSHIARSRSLYDQAVRHCLPDAAQQSRSIRTEAYLLLAIRAFHDPVPCQLRDTAGEALVELARTILSHEAPSSLAPLDAVLSPTFADDLKERALFIHCYSAYEIFASTWNQQFQDLVGALDDKICNQDILLAFYSGLMDAGLEHVFSIRRVQTRIRRFWNQMRIEGPAEYGIQNTQEIKTELDDWKRMIPIVSSWNNIDKSTNLDPLSLLMSYDYCICSLYQSELIVPAVEDYAVLLVAASENARCFHRLQETRPMAYCTWPALSEQFTVSMILLSCFWGTPYVYRTTAFQTPDTLQALEDCEATLSRFANRWEAAEIYLQTYTLFRSQTPVFFPDNPKLEFPDHLKLEANSFIQALEMRGVSLAVKAMMNRLVNSTPGFEYS